MTAPDLCDFKHVPHHEVEAHESEGWKICDGWRNYGHHLRYSVPMWRPVEDDDAR